MKYKDYDLKNVKKIEIEIVKEIIRICNKNSIKYFAVGGTALGAVRHNGFIPWDDDIDLGMMREDYEKFLKIAPTELNDNYELVHFSLYNDYPVYFAKVKKKNTLFIERGMSKLNIPKGIFVDIMPYDFCPSKKKEQIKYVKKTIFLNNLFIAKSVTTSTFEANKTKQTFKTIIRKIIHFFL
ncbi:MAG: LicD family protein, partial [Clostridia bacterium]|nr:LicD family protein [Clostridia bacterium]